MIFTYHFFCNSIAKREGRWLRLRSRRLLASGHAPPYLTADPEHQEGDDGLHDSIADGPPSPRKRSDGLLLGGGAMAAKDTHPSPDTLCILLARGKHLDGLVLRKIVYWYRYARAEIDGQKGRWIANPRTWWGRETCASLGQFDGATRRLKKAGLIEKRQWWFGGKNVLYVRPTKPTRDFLAAAQTWPAVEELAAQFKIGKGWATILDQLAAEVFKVEEPSFSELMNSSVTNYDEPGSAILAISNNSNNNLNLGKKSLQCAHSASPQCTDQSSVQNKNKAGQKSGLNLAAAKKQKFPTVEFLGWVWRQCSGKPFSVEENAVEFGKLAVFLEQLTEITGPYGKEDLRGRGHDIFAYAILHWKLLQESKDPVAPTINAICDKTGQAVDIWHEGGRPKWNHPVLTQV